MRYNLKKKTDDNESIQISLNIVKNVCVKCNIHWVETNKILLLEYFLASESFSSKASEKTKVPFEWLLTPDYPKRYLFQRGEVNTRCETNILNDFRRKRWRKAVGRELTFPMNRSLRSWKEEDYFRSRGCTEIYNKTAPGRLESPLYSTPFTVHDLRGPNNTSQALCRSGGSLLPGDFVLSSFRLTRDIRRRVDPVCFFIDRYRNGWAGESTIDTRSRMRAEG